MRWRGITEGPPFLSGATVAIAGSTNSDKFVAYPIARTGRGTVLINGVGEAMTGGTYPMDAEALSCFADWTFGWLDIPALMARAPEIGAYPMVDRDPLPFWGAAG